MNLILTLVSIEEILLFVHSLMSYEGFMCNNKSILQIKDFRSYLLKKIENKLYIASYQGVTQLGGLLPVF